MSSLLRIFPEADLGTVFMKVTFRNLLKGATCKTEKGVDGELNKVSAMAYLSQKKINMYSMHRVHMRKYFHFIEENRL
jgi:hypothetical protein